MAAIAKFVSFDGGIAFSDSVLKIQKRDEERGRLIPIENVAGIDVEEPLLGDDGCIRVQIAGKKQSVRNAIYFDEEQYDDALSFKAAFDSFVGQSAQALPPLEMFQPTAIANRPKREQRYTEPERPQRPARKRKRRFKWWYAAIAVVFVAILVTPSKKDEKEEPQQESMVYATMEPTASPEPTAEPTPEATAVVGFTSPPAATSPPVAEAPAQEEATYHGYKASTTVYVSNNGKIHLKSNCSGMKSYTTMTLGEAENRGYDECSKCF